MNPPGRPPRSRWLRARLLAICLLGCGLPQIAQAALHLQLDTPTLDPHERAASQALFGDVQARLPAAWRAALGEVPVRWRDDLPAAVHGRATGAGQVLLPRSLLRGWMQAGDEAARAPARAALVHELAHLLDRSAAGGFSRDPRLLDLAGWQQRVGQRGARDLNNGQVARSPDNYELTNPLEFVAVNLEYFLLDPSYACRRPSLARYFREHFDWAPPSENCTTDYPYLNAGRDFALQPLGRLEPERVYEVDYLLAEANDAWMSRWGHSMLRLVVCAPDRPRGPDCRLDLEHHLVLSYRAFVGDLQLSSWDGLTGVYPSRLFVLPLEQVIDEYTKVELRSLASVPLRLSRDEVEQLVVRAAEQHWSYDGDYYFVSNNCAVETLKLLRSGTDNPRLHALDSILPNGLLELMDARGLADTQVLDDPREALRLGYRFDSFRERYQAMFKVLRERLPITQGSVETWLEQPAETRRNWFTQADLRASAALLLLEQAALRRQLLLAQDELKRRYLTGRAAGDPSLNKAGAALEQILANSGFLSRPAELLEGGYGLPQQQEWERLEASSRDRQQQLRQLSDELDGEVRNLLQPERLAEMEANEANLVALGEHLRALHKASGGLELP